MELIRINCLGLLDSFARCLFCRVVNFGITIAHRERVVLKWVPEVIFAWFCFSLPSSVLGLKAKQNLNHCKTNFTNRELLAYVFPHLLWLPLVCFLTFGWKAPYYCDHITALNCTLHKTNMVSNNLVGRGGEGRVGEGYSLKVWVVIWIFTPKWIKK